MLHDVTPWLVAAVLLLLGAVLFGVVVSNDVTTSQSRELVIVSYGGSYQDAQRQAFFEPFEEQYNVTIRDIVYDGDIDQIESMVESGNVEWDVVAIETSLLHHGGREGLFEPIDFSVVSTSNLMPEAVNEYGIAICFWSNVLAYNTDQFAGPNAPSNWSDFWDLENFPGPRSLHDTPISTLEMALMADGVAAEDLYPLDVDRAFASLDQIRDAVAVWWQAGEEPAELLANGAVSMASAWNGRIYTHRTAGGEPVQEVWQGGLIDADFWVIPRGSQNTELAMEFINFASQQAQQAAFPTYIPYGPINLLAVNTMSARIAANVPTSPQNAVQQVFIDSTWWDENYDWVINRWNTWRRQ